MQQIAPDKNNASITIRLPDTVLAKIDEVRRKDDKMPSRPKVAREFILRGLGLSA